MLEKGLSGKIKTLYKLISVNIVAWIFIYTLFTVFFEDLLKPFRCFCGRGYKRKNHLLFHQRQECGKEPSFACKFCPYKAKQRSSMHRHVVRHETNLASLRLAYVQIRDVDWCTEWLLSIFYCLSQFPSKLISSWKFEILQFSVFFLFYFTVKVKKINFIHI